MGIPVVVANAGGLPVVEATNGFGVPMTQADNGYGTPVTLATNGYGIPAVFNPPLIPNTFVPSTLYFDFMSDKARIAGTSTTSTFPLTVTRATPPLAYAQDTAGVWTGFAPNVARRTDRGLLIEEARTNAIRNNSMQGAAAGTPGTAPTNWTVAGGGGLVTAIVGTGTENGVNYIDIRLSGTTSSAAVTAWSLEVGAPTAGFIVAAQNDVRTLSAFLKITAGSLANITSITLSHRTTTAAGSAINTYSIPVVPTTSWARYTGTATYAEATTGSVFPRILITPSGTGVAIDLTLRIGWPQLELGAFATSPIRTTTVAVTRAGEIIHVNLTTAPLASWYTQPEGTMFSEGSPYTGTLSNALVFNIFTSSAERHATGLPGVGQFQTVGITSSAGSGGGPVNGTGIAGVNKVSWAYKLNDFACSFNGATVSTDTLGPVPASVTTVRLGASPGSTIWSGYLRRVAFFPTRLPNATLQSITAA